VETKEYREEEERYWLKNLYNDAQKKKNRSAGIPESPTSFR